MILKALPAFLFPFSAGGAFALSVCGALAASPPINCGKASGQAGTAVERTICASPEFKAMDREIAALYDRALAVAEGEARHRVVAGQQLFVRRRGECGWAAHHSAHPGVAVEECVRNAMDGRVVALREAADGRALARR